jgi:hypothetical protein
MCIAPVDWSEDGVLRGWRCWENHGGSCYESYLRAAVSHQRVGAGRVCRASFLDCLDGRLVVRRLTVGVEEASGAVCVGEIHKFCQNIT